MICLTGALAACNGQKSADNSIKKVTFTYNYVNSPEAIYEDVMSGQTVEAPEDPEREDYIFDGWSANFAGTKDYDFTEPVTKDIRLFAKWKKSVAVVTFDVGADAEEYKQKEQRVNVDTMMEEPSEIPIRENYVFQGWYVDAKCTQKFDFTNTLIEKDTTIYAKWNQEKAKVTFVASGEDDILAEEDVEVNQKVERPSKDPEKEDYFFENWYSDYNCTQIFDFNTAITEDTKIYAGWRLKNATVTLNYQYDGASPQEEKVRVGQKLKLKETPLRDGYEFVGWYMDADCTEEFDSKKKIENNITLYAGWKAMEYTVVFHDNYPDGEEQEQNVVYGSTITEPEDPQREGYLFMGWYQEAGCRNEYELTTPVTDNLELYASWMKDSSGESAGAVTEIISVKFETNK